MYYGSVQFISDDSRASPLYFGKTREIIRTMIMKDYKYKKGAFGGQICRGSTGEWKDYWVPVPEEELEAHVEKCIHELPENGYKVLSWEGKYGH